MSAPARRTAALLLALAAPPSACSRGERAGPAPAAAVQRYTARGEVVRLPEPDRAAPELVLRHEAVDGFADRSGATVGMDAMVMPFAVDPAAQLAGIAPGDKVEFRFAVDWSRAAFWIERIEKLPADTPLRFGKARPPGAAQRE
jgi:Cu/Ag efflux protein CusF